MPTIAWPSGAVRRLRHWAALLSAGLGVCATTATTALAADPFAANNGLYPVASAAPGQPARLLWNGPLRVSNFDYPADAPPSDWLTKVPRQALTVSSAPEYVRRLKAHVEPSLRRLIEDPSGWSPQATGWYDMPWQAEGDAASGREAILGSYSGQVLAPGTFPGLDVPLQNHTVIYYDRLSATMLKRLWANPYRPNLGVVDFPEGAMVIKAGAVTPTPEQWPVVAGSTQWHVWRPSAQAAYEASRQPGAPVPPPQLVPLRVLQFDIIVKDSVAAPQTGWVFATYVYHAQAPGKGTWDKLVPLGAQWGNDPKIAALPPGVPLPPLTETWINREGAPAYALEQLGWGGRLSGPIDVAKRHGVIYTDGQPRSGTQRASSCMSCHGTAQSPFMANLYPSPNRAFPPDGGTFLLYPPGSTDWNRWFQNRSGRTPQTPGAVALDYDMLIMFAVGAAEAAAGGLSHTAPRRLRVH